MLTCTATPDYDPFTIIVDSKGVAVRPIDLMMSFTVDSQGVATRSIEELNAALSQPQGNPLHIARANLLLMGCSLN